MRLAVLRLKTMSRRSGSSDALDAALPFEPFMISSPLCWAKARLRAMSRQLNHTSEIKGAALKRKTRVLFFRLEAAPNQADFVDGASQGAVATVLCWAGQY